MATVQKVVSGLPDDLDTEKIAFLEFDHLPVTDDLPKARQRDFNWRNENAKKANNILIVEAKKYPFAYTIASRSDLERLAKQGYRYVPFTSWIYKVERTMNSLRLVSITLTVMITRWISLLIK